MQTELITNKVNSLLENDTVKRVIGWKNGEFFYDKTPYVFTKENVSDFVYDDFCAANLSKYLILDSKVEGKVAVLLKPCDTYSFNELLKEHRIIRENVYVVGIPCDGMIDIEKIRALGIKGITNISVNSDDVTVETIYGEKKCNKKDVLLEKCISCKGKKHFVYDELIGEEGEVNAETSKFDEVEKLENMTADERYAFWREQLSKCIRCNACRNVCPACTCTKCIFDNEQVGVNSKANADTFEENMFHIIRAFHVAGRCTDCGECSRVCPQNIPLHLLNRKFIKDANELYGEYQAGEDAEAKGPLTSYTKEDAEPSIVMERGNA